MISRWQELHTNKGADEVIIFLMLLTSEKVGNKFRQICLVQTVKFCQLPALRKSVKLPCLFLFLLLDISSLKAMEDTSRTQKLLSVLTLNCGFFSTKQYKSKLTLPLYAILDHK